MPRFSGRGMDGEPILQGGKPPLPLLGRETRVKGYAQPSPLMPGLANATPPSTVTVEPTT
jgi:hypothetical protein